MTNPNCDQSNSDASRELRMLRQREQIGGFFREKRIAAGLSELDVTGALEFETPGILVAYETGRTAIPLEDIFALTNLLNVPPEEVLDFIHGAYSESK